MTTIAYRAGVLAADSVALGTGTKFLHVVKIARNSAGDLAGACGDAGFAYSFLEWFRAGEQEPKIKLISDQAEQRWDKAAIFRTNGRWEIYEPAGMFLVAGPFFAMGSGRNIALGAMFVGASPREAIEAAIALDDGTFGHVQELAHQSVEAL